MRASAAILATVAVSTDMADSRLETKNGRRRLRVAERHHGGAFMGGHRAGRHFGPRRGAHPAAAPAAAAAAASAASSHLLHLLFDLGAAEVEQFDLESQVGVRGIAPAALSP
jgi:hypothetical protein